MDHDELTGRDAGTDASAWVWSLGTGPSRPVRARWLAPAEVFIDGVVLVRPGGWVDRASGTRVDVRVRSLQKRDAREPGEMRSRE